MYDLRLYHEEWRTNEVLINQGRNDEDELANFSFRGFKGDYNIKLFDGDNEVKQWSLNLDKDTEWILSLESDRK